MDRTRLAWLGTTRDEFASIFQSLGNQFPVQQFASVAEAQQAVCPDAAVVAVARPGELIRDLLAPLRGAWATARCVYLLGDWCCGTKRLTPTLDESYVYVHEGFSVLLNHIGNSRCALVPPEPSALVAIYSPCRSYREAIADAFALRGLKTIVADIRCPVEARGVDVVVWDCPRNVESQQTELATLRRRHAAANIIATCTYPREWETQRYRSLGVDVLAQPFDLGQLWEHVQRASRGGNSAAA